MLYNVFRLCQSNVRVILESLLGFCLPYHHHSSVKHFIETLRKLSWYTWVTFSKIRGSGWDEYHVLSKCNDSHLKGLFGSGSLTLHMISVSFAITYWYRLLYKSRDEVVWGRMLKKLSKELVFHWWWYCIIMFMICILSLYMVGYPRTTN